MEGIDEPNEDERYIANLIAPLKADKAAWEATYTPEERQRDQTYFEQLSLDENA